MVADVDPIGEMKAKLVALETKIDKVDAVLDELRARKE
jgi:hypothetical protein